MQADRLIQQTNEPASWLTAARLRLGFLHRNPDYNPRVETSQHDLAISERSECANCGSPLAGTYCHRCGQKAVNDPLAFKVLTGDLVSHFTDIEHSRFFRTLSALLTRPGRLTNEYIAGRRADWITPLKLYLTIFALSIFLYSAFKSVAVYDISTLAANEKTGALTKLIAQAAQKKHMTADVFAASVNAKWRTYLSVSQFIYPLLFAVILKLFYFRRRFTEHLVFSLHFQALALLVVIIAWPLYRLTGIALTQWSVVLAVAVTLIMIVYLTIAVGAVYRQGRIATITKGLTLYLGYYLIYILITYATLAVAIVVFMRSK